MLHRFVSLPSCGPIAPPLLLFKRLLHFFDRSAADLVLKFGLIVRPAIENVVLKDVVPTEDITIILFRVVF